MAKESCLFCYRSGKHLYKTEDGIIRVCDKHYITELQVDIELWENEKGSFCILCGDAVSQFVTGNISLPCLCMRHLIKEMKRNEQLANQVFDIFIEQQKGTQNESKKT
jgi:hypothetical protein